MSLEDVSTYELITLRLETGREISSKRCLFAATYGNLLVGRPGPRADRNHLELLPHNLRSVFGNWPVHIIEPERRVSSGVEHLPVVEIAALFTSMPMGSSIDWTGMVLVWHEDSMHPPVSEGNKRKIAAVDWDALAEPFEF